MISLIGFGIFGALSGPDTMLADNETFADKVKECAMFGVLEKEDGEFLRYFKGFFDNSFCFWEGEHKDDFFIF